MNDLNHSRTLADRLFAACLAIVAPLFGTAAINPTVSPDVFYVTGATRKIAQLIGDTDFETLRPNPDAHRGPRRPHWYGPRHLICR